VARARKRQRRQAVSVCLRVSRVSNLRLQCSLAPDLLPYGLAPLPFLLGAFREAGVNARIYRPLGRTTIRNVRWSKPVLHTQVVHGGGEFPSLLWPLEWRVIFVDVPGPHDIPPAR
jgi:hypothetical protein